MKSSVLWLASCTFCAFSWLFSSAAVGQTPVKLQLNWKPEPQFGGFYQAALDGEYVRHGLAVELVPGGVGTPTVQMVGAGRVPFAVVSADELVLARSRGNDVVALFAVYQTNPQGIMAHASRGFNDIGDIFAHEGTVAMQRGLPYAAYLERKYGFDKVRVVPSPGGDLSIFRRDPSYSMQCFVTSEPIAAEKLGLDVQTFLIADAGWNPYTTVLVTREGYLKENAAVAMAMVAAVREGWDAYLQDPSEANAHMRGLNPTMDEATFAAAAEAQRPLIATLQTDEHGLGHMSIERWTTLVQQMTELGLVPAGIDPKACFIAPRTAE